MLLLLLLSLLLPLSSELVNRISLSRASNRLSGSSLLDVEWPLAVTGTRRDTKSDDDNDDNDDNDDDDPEGDDERNRFLELLIDVIDVIAADDEDATFGLIGVPANVTQMTSSLAFSTVRPVPAATETGTATGTAF